MLKYTLKVLIPLSIIFLAGCTPKGISPIPKNFIGDIDEIRSLTAEELADNKKTINTYNQKFKNSFKFNIYYERNRRRNCCFGNGIYNR
jgi:hypothetical protein